MNKFHILLDDTTILNFPFILKLLKRYYLISLITPVLILICGVYFYKSQNTVYSIVVPFMNVGNRQDNAQQSLAQLLGESTARTSEIEILALQESTAFNMKVADALLGIRSKLERMDFRGLKEKHRPTFEELFGDCQENQKCIQETLGFMLPNFYNIVIDQTNNSKFFLSIKSLDHATTKLLAKVISEIIVKNNIADTKHNIVEQRKMLETLVTEKAEAVKGYSKVRLEEDISLLNEQIKITESKLLDVNILLNRKDSEYAKTKLSISEAEGTKIVKIDSKVRVDSEKLKKLEEDILSLRKEIMGLTSKDEGLYSQTEQAVIDDLKKNLQYKIQSLKKLNKRAKDIKHEDAFYKQKNKKLRDSKFRLKLLGAEIKTLKKERSNIIAKKNSYFNKRKELNEVFSNLKPTYEHIAILEEKLLKLSIIESTIVADIKFDDFLPPVSSFRRTKLKNIIVYSTILSLFISFFLIAARFLLDSRVHSVDELASYFKDTQLLGEAPQI